MTTRRSEVEGARYLCLFFSACLALVLHVAWRSTYRSAIPPAWWPVPVMGTVFLAASTLAAVRWARARRHLRDWAADHRGTDRT